MKRKKLTRPTKRKYTKKAKKLGNGPNCKTAETLGKHYKGRSKKHLSEKQKKALSAGRKVLKHLRTGRAVSEPKEPILIKEGYLMAKTTKKHRKTTKRHTMQGFDGRRRKRHSRKGVQLHGAPGGFNAGSLAVDIAGLLAGAIGVSFAASMIPVKDAKIKALIPIALGLVGLSMPKLSKNHFINRAALGSLAIGGYTLTKTFLPSMPLMGASDTAEGIGYAIENLPAEEKAILGIMPTEELEYSGEVETFGEDDFSGEVETFGAEPGEMLGSQPGEMLGEYSELGEDFE